MQNIQDSTITDTMSAVDVEAELAGMRERREKREAQLSADEAEMPRLATGLPPKKKTVAERTTAKPVKAEKAPKVPKVKVPKVEVVKVAWSPSDAVRDLLCAIDAIDHFDKKGIAAIVKAAVELRELAKQTRQAAADEGDIGLGDHDAPAEVAGE